MAAYSVSTHATHGALLVLVEFRGEPLASGDRDFAPSQNVEADGDRWDVRFWKDRFLIIGIYFP